MNILLIITGSVAAEKMPALITQLQDAGHGVTAVITQAGKEFISVPKLEELTQNRVFDDLWDAEMEAKIGHIELSRQADMLLVAPATANMLAKMAHGLCDDLASTLLLATNKPVFVAPAMNVKMWEHAATQRNVAQLKADGVGFIGPVAGAMRCGETGMGRMSEPAEIVQCIIQEHHSFGGHSVVKPPPESTFALSDSPVKGELRENRQFLVSGQQAASSVPEGLRLTAKARRPKQEQTIISALITAGPTRERIDPVRYLSNDSSGKQGYAIAEALAQAGVAVTLISGPTALPCPAGVRRVDVESAAEMRAACEAALPVEIAICAAAVADFRPVKTENAKLKRGDAQEMTLQLTANPDILKLLSYHQNRPQIVVGFAAETNDLITNAQAKLRHKGCDMILANDVAGGAVFGADETQLHAITAQGTADWGKLTKQEAAHKLVAWLLERLG